MHNRFRYEDAVYLKHRLLPYLDKNDKIIIVHSDNDFIIRIILKEGDMISVDSILRNNEWWIF